MKRPSVGCELTQNLTGTRTDASGDQYSKQQVPTDDTVLLHLSKEFIFFFFFTAAGTLKLT